MLIILEGAVASCRGYRSYRVNDAFGSFALGLVQQLVGVIVKLVALRLALPTPYVLVLQHCRVFEWEPTSIATYVLALLGTDLCYYLYHRSAHAWHVFWTEHSVHHSGEDYNLATALRQSTLGFLTSWLFYVPLAALGLPLGPALAHAQMNLLFQFWIHTAQVGGRGGLLQCGSGSQQPREAGHVCSRLLPLLTGVLRSALVGRSSTSSTL